MCIFVLLIVTILSGAAGGFASYLLAGSSKQDPEESSNLGINIKILDTHPWLLNIFLGIIASFIVPLFLSLAQSKLIEEILGTNTSSARGSLLTYIGFCLLAAISFKNFIISVSGKALSALQDQVQENQQKIDKVEEIAENAAVDRKPDISEFNEASVRLPQTGSLVSEPPTRVELQVLDALQKEAYDRRTVSGICKDAKLTRPIVLKTLEAL